jgi:hypothetical protein
MDEDCWPLVHCCSSMWWCAADCMLRESCCTITSGKRYPACSFPKFSFLETFSTAAAVTQVWQEQQQKQPQHQQQQTRTLHM